MTFLSWIILALILLDALSRVVARHLNRACLDDPLPQRLAEIYNPREYRKYQHYLAEGIRLAQLEELADVIILIAFWMAGGFGWLDAWVQQVTAQPVLGGLIFFGILVLGKAVFGLPFTIYRTFGIEARYGFNRTSPRTFVIDLLKVFFLSVILGACVGGSLLWILNRFGPQYWWLCWILWIVFAMLLQYVAPRWIMPWFNKFEPLAEGELKRRIETYAQSINFPLKKIFVMDSSRRSSKANAFFTGFGKNRRIVLFDTIVEKHPPNELLAVLAHEMGHYKLHHIQINMLLTYGISGVFLLGLAVSMTWQPLLNVFGLSASVHGGLLAAAILFTPLNSLMNLASNWYSRKNEFAADHFAAKTTGNPKAMIEALIRLSRDNLSHLTPHPSWVWLTYSHPPVLLRIEALSRHVNRSSSSC